VRGREQPWAERATQRELQIDNHRIHTPTYPIVLPRQHVRVFHVLCDPNISAHIARPLGDLFAYWKMQSWLLNSSRNKEIPKTNDTAWL
jgi:hypothetical protein